MKYRSIIAITLGLAIVVFAAACGGTGTSTTAGMKPVTEKKVNDNLTVVLSNPEGKLKNGEQELLLSFKDGSGKPVEINAAVLNFKMPAMGSMSEMNDPAVLTTTSTPGEFKGKVNLQMAGEWQAQISYEGKETGKMTMTVTAY